MNFWVFLPSTEAVSNQFPARRAAHQLETLAGAEFAADAGPQLGECGKIAEDVHEESHEHPLISIEYPLISISIYEYL